MQIKEIKKSDDKIKYSKIANKEGNIFNTLEWLNIFKNNIKLFGIYENDGKLICGFSLFKDKKFGLNIYKNPPFTPCVGPFFQKPNNIEKERKIILLLANCTNNLPSAIISFSLNKNIDDVIPFIWKKFKTTPRYTYIINLDNPEKIFARMSKNRRNDINKATKDGLIVKKTSDFSMVKRLILKTFLRQKKKINQLLLDKILFNFANDNNSFAFITFKNKKPIATTFCIYDKNTAYYLLGGYDYKNKHHGAGALCLWKSIEYAQKIGLEYFDFEGSIVPQIEKYFRGFGGKLISYFRISKAKLPLEVILKLFKRELF